MRYPILLYSCKRRFSVGLFLFVFLCSLQGIAQTQQQNGNESLEAFVQRLGPAHHLLSGNITKGQWNQQPFILALYADDENQPSQLVGVLFLQEDANHYTPVLMDTINSEGGSPHVDTVFFANTDKDKALELIVMVSWEQHHHDFEGTYYGCFVYDNIPEAGPKKIRFLSAMSQRLEPGCECEWRDGSRSKARYKSVSDVRAALHRWGYGKGAVPKYLISQNSN